MPDRIGFGFLAVLRPSACRRVVIRTRGMMNGMLFCAARYGGYE
jgi:hypothetical protein